MASLADSARTELRRAQVPYTDVVQQGTTLQVKLRPEANRQRAREVLAQLDPDVTLSVADDGTVTLARTPQSVQTQRDAAIRQSIEIIRRRVDETGTREPTIQQQGQDRILVQLPGLRDPERVKRLIGTTAKLTFRMVDTDASPGDAQRGRVPPGDDLLPEEGRAGQPGGQILVRKRVMVSGETLIDAQPSFQDAQPVVSFRFDSIGARRFGEATTENVGKPFAIVLDNKVISAPVIREPITGGRGIISGNFTTQTASDLALLLRAGALPAPLTVIEERSVGPDLGADSIRAGSIASLLGFVMVAVFMVLVYGRYGFIADIALVVNLIMIVACMSLLQATLTLPGIAGIVLTMGMSVDANVLIFERIREEQRNGRSVIAAVDTGFARAMTTIVDSNLTTLIATFLLYLFGTGPVRGFAVTLTVGIITSMFTAVMLTRLLMVLWMRRFRPKTILV
jgi:preprotein translocase subunit SecD